jgi:hypothetical protein
MGGAADGQRKHRQVTVAGLLWLIAIMGVILGCNEWFDFGPIGLILTMCLAAVAWWLYGEFREAKARFVRVLLRHPILTGVSFECVLVLLFGFFPEGPCNQPLVGVAVMYLHYPAFFVTDVVLGLDVPDLWSLALAAVLMVPVWIVLISGLSRLLRRVTKDKPTR